MPGNCRPSTATSASILEAVTDVVNRMSKVDNYAKSIEIKKQQVESLESRSRSRHQSLSESPRGVPIDYLDVLTAQNELFDAIKDLIDTKGEQLAAVANTYQALGGGLPPIFMSETAVILPPLPHLSGPPSPAGPPPPLPPGLQPPPGTLTPIGPPRPWPPFQADSSSPDGPSAPVGTSSPTEPPSPDGPKPAPTNPPVQQKPATDLEPLPKSASNTR